MFHKLIILLTTKLRLAWLHRFLFTLAYTLLAKMILKNSQVHYLNYGFADDSSEAFKAALPQDEQTEHLSCRLYRKTISDVELNGRRVLEVGCGCGGGLAHLARALAPAKAVGLDVVQANIAWCRRAYSIPGLSFQQGEAERLPFPSNCFDVVLNVESSHCYGNIRLFLSEVFRVLCPGGVFCFADLRPSNQVPLLKNQLRDSGLILLQEEDISTGVFQALQRQSAQRHAYIKSQAPRWLHSTLINFSGAEGGTVHASFSQGTRTYLRFLLKKP